MDDRDSIDLRQAEEMHPCAVIQEIQNGLKDIHNRTESRTSHLISLLKTKSGLLLLDPTAAGGALDSSKIKRSKLLGEIDGFEAMTSKQCDALRTAVARYWDLDTSIAASGTATTTTTAGKKATVDNHVKDAGQAKAVFLAEAKNTTETSTSASKTPIEVQKSDISVDEQKVTQANIPNRQLSQIGNAIPQKLAIQPTEKVLELHKARNATSDDDWFAARGEVARLSNIEKQRRIQDENKRISDEILRKSRTVTLASLSALDEAKKSNKLLAARLPAPLGQKESYSMPQKKQSLIDISQWGEPFSASEKFKETATDLPLEDHDDVRTTSSTWGSDSNNFTPPYEDSDDEYSEKDLHVPKLVKKSTAQLSETATRQSTTTQLPKPKPVAFEKAQAGLSPTRSQFPKRTSSMPLNPPLDPRSKETADRLRNFRAVKPEDYLDYRARRPGFERRPRDKNYPASTFLEFGERNNPINPSRLAMSDFDPNRYYRERALPLPYAPGPERNTYYCVRPDLLAYDNISPDFGPQSATFSDTRARLGTISSHLPPAYPQQSKSEREKETYNEIKGGNVKKDTGADPQKSAFNNLGGQSRTDGPKQVNFVATQDSRPFRSLNDPVRDIGTSASRNTHSYPGLITQNPSFTTRLPKKPVPRHKDTLTTSDLPLRPEQAKAEKKPDIWFNAFEHHQQVHNNPVVPRQAMPSRKVPLVAVHRNMDGDWVSEDQE